MKLHGIFLTFWLAIQSAASFAHEFWIEPTAYTAQPGSELRATFRNGEFFVGTELAFFDFRSERLECAGPDGLKTLRPDNGSDPAVVIPSMVDGLTILVHQTKAGTVTYKTLEKFAAFAASKGFPNTEARHQDRNLPGADFKETYTRFTKSLVASGAAEGADSEFGLETEFVALTNPYVDTFTGTFAVQLLYLASPRAEAQMEVFEKSPNGTVNMVTIRTDADGIAEIDVKGGHSYLLNSVVLRPAPETSDAVWETLWASMTFAVPDRVAD